MTAAALLVQADGQLPLPWLQAPLQQALHNHRGHALLVHASPGLGAAAFALVLAQSWLCELKSNPQTSGQGADAQPPHPACGSCGSCKLFQSHVHPDLLVLMPETLRQQHAWPMSGDKADADDSKAETKKPAKRSTAKAKAAATDDAESGDAKRDAADKPAAKKSAPKRATKKDE